MLVSFAIARQFLAPGWALCLAMVFWFGTSLASTGGTALWSHNTATLLAATAIWLSLRACFAGAFQAWPLIALTLFLAYLCRPTLLLLSPLLLAAIVLFDWKTALRTMLLDAGLLLLFVLWSLHEFGQMLPDYYLPKRLSSEDPWLAVYGNLLSPARGLLVYSPFLAVGLAFLVGFRASSRRHWLVLSIGLAWPAVHLVAISRFPHWWGGHSFGSRLTMDILPGLLVLVAASWAELRFRRIAACALAPLIAFSVFVHSYQGLYNVFVTRWNGEPDIDLFPVYLFDWKYPQFLHGEHRHLRRLAEFHATRVASLVPGDHVGPTSTHLAFVDWSEPISGRRTSKALHPWILFKVDDATMFRGGLTIWLSADEPHAVALQLNDRTLGVFAVGRDVTPISVPENGLPIHHGINVLQLRRLDGMGSGSRAFGSGSIRFNSIALE